MEINKLNKFINASNSWDDLVYRLGDKSLNDKFKGDVFERLTQAYLLTSPQYKSVLKNVWMSHEVPSRILDKLNLPREDFGIDIIAQTKDNKFWSIQCKYRSNQEKALTYKELSTFAALSFVTAKNVSLAVVAHSTSKPVRNRKLLKNLTEIGLETWLSLTDQDWKRIQSLCANKQIKLKKRNPRPHQKPAIKKAVTHFKDKKNTRGKLIMPCGTGKSLTAFWIAEALDAKKIILAVPSLHLIKQSLNDWVQEYLAAGINPEWMCVCSDKSAGNVEIDDFDIDLQDLGIPVTTNKDEIRNFLSKRSKHHKIIFTTYQSGHLLKQVCKNQKIKFDLAIFDEAHKTVGFADKSFAALLHEKNIHIKHRVFMTATERKIVHRREDEVVSMDDTKIYGNIFYQLSFRKAIDNGIISDYKIVTLTVTNSQVENLIENNSLLNIKGSGLNSTESIYVATGIAVKKAMKKYKINHAISFHRSIPLAKNFRGLLDTFNKEKTLRPVSKNYHVSSKQKTGERAQMLKDFASQKPSLITNARCLTEGVDIPAVDCILFADPKQSLVDIVQATGRAMRPAPGKKFGYVILPLVVPDNYEVDDFAEETAFRHITKVISVLSTHDERISEEFRLIRAGTISKGKIINIDSALPIGHKIKLDKFAESINARVWDKVAKVNFRNFDEARNYARRLQLNNWREWLALENLPPDIPREPKKVYKLDWISVSDWLGTPYISTSKRKYRDFIGARKYVQSLKLAGQKQYYELAREKKLPIDIPQSPNNTYKDKGWVSWGDWLGTGRVATNKIQFLKFIEARAYVRTLKLKGKTDWYQFIQSKKFPKFLPTNPQRTYKKKGWISWGDWLGTKTVSVKNRSMIFLDFKKSRNFSRSLNLLSAKEWRKFVLRKDFPSNIPKDPYGYYKDKGWVSWGDWLGTGRAHKKFLSFVEARAYARSLGFKKMIQWRNFAKSSLRPKNIPSNPWEVYSDSYISIKDWLEEP
ncbi:DEAD/DEAH box helicase family protein [Gammaproteobacteria bacterium]|nr:DEAD/DEAH box helicase family protein [Gammaproteobacteria bacterium]